jgi:hypothetical protein
MGDTPLYRLTINGQQEAIQQKHWCVGRDAEIFGDRCRGIANGDAFLGLAEQGAVLLRKRCDAMRDGLPF